MHPKRVIVSVNADFSLDGQVTPRTITWPDGRVFTVDRVLDVRPGAAKSGGSGLVYTCRIQGREVPLYFDLCHEVWFMDGRS